MNQHPILFAAVILIWVVLIAAVYRRLVRPYARGGVLLVITFLFLVAACYALLANWNLREVRVHILGSIACLLLAFSLRSRLPRLAEPIPGKGHGNINRDIEEERRSGRIQWAAIVLIFFAAAFISIAFNHI